MAALFGAVMALVALTVAFATLGVYLRDSGGAAWFVALFAVARLPGLNVASRRGQSGPRPGAAARARRSSGAIAASPGRSLFRGSRLA
jgi:hypothetical protein